MRAEPVYVGIDAGHKRGRDALGIWAVGRPFLLHLTSIKKEPRRPVLFDVGRPEHLRQNAQAAPSPKINLEEPVTGCIEALHEEAIVKIFGIDMRYTPFIDENFHGFF